MGKKDLERKRKAQAALFVTAETLSLLPVHVWANYVAGFLWRLEVFALGAGTSKQFERTLERLCTAIQGRLYYGTWSVDKTPVPGPSSGLGRCPGTGDI